MTDSYGRKVRTVPLLRHHDDRLVHSTYGHPFMRSFLLPQPLALDNAVSLASKQALTTFGELLLFFSVHVVALIQLFKVICVRTYSYIRMYL